MSRIVVKSWRELPHLPPGGVLTIGNFDGVHRGHQEILRQARLLADRDGRRLLAMTFEPPAAALLRPDNAPELLLPLERKCQLLGEFGADDVLVVRTSREFLDLPPETFVREWLVGRIAPAHIVEGPGFFFGHNRTGTIQTLQEMSAACGFAVTQVEPAVLELPGRGGVRISSSLIRELIRSGDVASAATCLTRPYALHGRVVEGDRRGLELGLPTANVDPGPMVVPGDGVYAAQSRIGGREYASAVSIGTKPTFGGTQRCIEAHLLDAHGDFYGLPIEITFLQWLRGQQSFADVAALLAQVAEDIKRVRQILP